MELEPEPELTHFDSTPAWKNESAPTLTPTPILRPVLCKIYCTVYFELFLLWQLNKQKDGCQSGAITTSF
jgi:hypothetical protein